MLPKVPQPIIKNPRVAYLICHHARDMKGRFLPLLATEFEQGFIVVDGALSTDRKISKKIVDQMNEGLGLSDVEVKSIIASTFLEFYCMN